jgi:hypothetical protein
MSDRSLWLEEWCPCCRAAPGSRCRLAWGYGKTRPPSRLHVAKCKADPGEPCRTPSGREAACIHEARSRPGRHELLSSEAIWQELLARGATIAIVLFSGRAGRGGRTDRIVLRRVEGDDLVDIERWSSRDDLCHALEAPVWDRFGSFAGQPAIAGTVTWIAADRSVVIEGRRGDARFEELV